MLPLSGPLIERAGVHAAFLAGSAASIGATRLYDYIFCIAAHMLNATGGSFGKTFGKGGIY